MYFLNIESLSSAEQNHSIPLKDHPQIPYIIDTLGRREKHHLHIQSTSSEKIHLALLKSIALQIHSHNASKALRESSIIYIDAQKTFEHELKIINEKISIENKLIIFAIHDSSFSQNESPFINQLIQSKLTNNQWRFIIFTSNPPSTTPLFSVIRLKEPNASETLAILKTFKDELETFHHITIPDDIFPYAISLASHYLSGHVCLDTTLELLDSSAARTSALESSEQNSQSIIPTLTTTMLTQVISDWTQIPLSHIHHNKFKLLPFLHSMQQKILGQDAALHTIGTLLQSACIVKNREKTASMNNLLLVGPTGVGKKSFVLHLANYLFTCPETVFQIDLNKHYPAATLSDIYVTIPSSNRSRITLLEAIRSKPYAIFLLENIHEMPEKTLALFRDIIIHGHTFDHRGKLYDFQHSIIIVTTNQGSDEIAALKKIHDENESSHMMDLMQLVLSESSNKITTASHISQQEVREHILPTLKPFFSSKLLQHMHVVPFVALDASSIEKIINIQLNNITQSLEEEFGIELSYAPEVVRFLMVEMIKSHENMESLKTVLEQHVYANIANEILARIDEKTRPRRLALLLNESGQMLRCEFIITHEAVVYKI